MPVSTGDDSGGSVNPLTYVIVPLAAAFACVAVIWYIRVRRLRRRFEGMDPRASMQDRYMTPGGHIVHVSRRNGWGGAARRWAAGSNMRSQEGLNELGEAPPAYDGRKDGGGGGSSSGGGGGGDAVEMADLEAGQRPPEYFARVPERAVVRTNEPQRAVSHQHPAVETERNEGGRSWLPPPREQGAATSSTNHGVGAADQGTQPTRSTENTSQPLSTSTDDSGRGIRGDGTSRQDDASGGRP